MKIVSWNVNGLRAILSKGFLDVLSASKADVYCLQEIKARPDQVDCHFGDYTCHWNPAQRPGYSGTATLTRETPIAVTTGIGEPDHDTEGRVLTAEFADFFIVNVYVPNVGRELARLPYRVNSWGPAFRAYLASLKKPVIVCGDLNVAHTEIDLARPKENVGNAGFTTEEREDFDKFLANGLVDSFRHFESTGGHYTWWSYQNSARPRNIGWRIDYACVSETLVPRLKSSFIQPEIQGSDHCPVGVSLD
jgi:exodeoxyribonuclease-3